MLLSYEKGQIVKSVLGKLEMPHWFLKERPNDLDFSFFFLNPGGIDVLLQIASDALAFCCVSVGRMPSLSDCELQE